MPKKESFSVPCSEHRSLQGYRRGNPAWKPTDRAGLFLLLFVLLLLWCPPEGLRGPLLWIQNEQTDWFQPTHVHQTSDSIEPIPDRFSSGFRHPWDPIWLHFWQTTYRFFPVRCFVREWDGGCFLQRIPVPPAWKALGRAEYHWNAPLGEEKSLSLAFEFHHSFLPNLD